MLKFKLNSYLLFVLIMASHILLSQSKVIKESIELTLRLSNEVAGMRFNSTSCQNDVTLKIMNRSDTPVEFYELWNTWGYETFSFEIATEDSVYSIRKKAKLWWRNFPSKFRIVPGDEYELDFKLLDTGYVCLEKHSEGRSRNRAGSWQGFPKLTGKATLTAIYTPPSRPKLISGGKFNSRRRNYRNVYRDAGDQDFATDDTRINKEQSIDKDTILTDSLIGLIQIESLRSEPISI